MVFVSGCLYGENCKYNGGNNLREELKKLLENEEVVLVCPECMGNMTTPRSPSEINFGGNGKMVTEGKGKVISKEGEDVTSFFLKGANEVLRLAKELKPSCIYLKQGSPSCGCGVIYDGTFSSTKKEGVGVTASILLENGFKIIPVE
ncbi:MAG: DUF523 domain-containing protein [Clostridia bacterium]|nr:DUF523 domain-containing protein [Clostridia bacterium]